MSIRSCISQMVRVAFLPLSVMLLAYACSDEMEADRFSPSLHFNVEISEAWKSGNVSDTEKDTSAAVQRMLPSDLSDTAAGRFYLHHTVIDTIASLKNPKSNEVSGSRALPQNEMYPSFGVLSFAYTGIWSEELTPNYMYNVEIKQQAGIWKSNPDYYWPGEHFKIRFYAYAPYNGTTTGAYCVSDQSAAGFPMLSCTVPSAVENQKDLLVASSDELAGNKEEAVNLPFKHVMTAVQFKEGDETASGKITGITLKGVYSKGNLNMETGKWDAASYSAPADFSQTLTPEVEIGGSTPVGITSGAQTFMMLPQTLPADAEIHVTFIDKENKSHQLKAKIGGQIWPKGKTVVYKISTSSLTWEYVIETQNTEYSYKGGTGNVGLKVYKKHLIKGKETVAVPWEVLDPDPETALWISLTGNKTGQGSSTDFESLPIKIGAQSLSDESLDDLLKKKPAKGTPALPYNLSNVIGAEIVENTANCYVVDAPGTYSLPLVYGNAIKNGQDNKVAYTSNYGGINGLPIALNHLGKAITSPYIYENKGCTAEDIKGARVVWQDAPALVSGLTLSADKKQLEFQVPQGSIKQGNAVIAVTDQQDRIMWSWHIWVTPEELDRTVSLKKTQFEFMPVNLGWCGTTSVQYCPEYTHKLKVKLENGEIKEILIKQTAYIGDANNGNNPFYEWGRKDPFVSAESLISNNNKQWYDHNNVEKTTNPLPIDKEPAIKIDEVMRQLIQHPDMIASKDLSNKDIFKNYDLHFVNLWNNDADPVVKQNDKLVKTIYDPCPIGFCVPPISAFQNNDFTTDNTLGNKPQQLEKGDPWFWKFKGNNGQNLIFPLPGMRNIGYDFRPEWVNEHGLYWAATPEKTAQGSKARILDLQTQTLGVEDLREMAYGLSIRPIKENPAVEPSVWTKKLEVTLPPVSCKGITKGEVSVKSYRESNTSQKQALPWEVEFFNEKTGKWQSTSPVDWLTIPSTDGTAKGIGNVSEAETFEITVAEQTDVEVIDQDKVLISAPALGSDATPYNLSNATGADAVENTANCYIVNAPGVYSLPLVYGNAIKNGVANTAAYNGTQFINHLGKQITAPEIWKHQDCTPSKAELLWQDAKGLIESVELQGDADHGYRIVFKADQNGLKQGNAILGVYDSQPKPQIMWSWHIWVTSQNLEATLPVKNFDGSRIHHFMPINLGWCSEGVDTYYKGRTLKMRINGEEYQIVQRPQLVQSVKGTSNHYQWGRKDPFPGIVPSDATLDAKGKPKDRYDINGQLLPEESLQYSLSNKKTDQILHPDQLATGIEMLVDNWTAKVKTIYDPCPSGFWVAEGDAFSAFHTNTGGSTHNSVKIPVSYVPITNSKIIDGFLCTIDGVVIFLPASGRYYFNDNSGHKRTEGRNKHGLYWYRSLIKNNNLSHYFNVPHFLIQPNAYNSAPNQGICIRPVKEE